eukprot:gene11095-3802_t
MNIIVTAIILIFTILSIPYIILNYTEPISSLQYELLVQVFKTVTIPVIVVLWITGVITQNVSQVDKMWSIIPFFYGLFFAYPFGFNQRTLIMLGCAFIWGLRLTLNFVRRGGYSFKFWSGDEDYRWLILRKKVGTGLVWEIFHLFFICIYQNVILFLITLPFLKCAVSTKPVGIVDYVLAAIVLLLVLVEMISDNQQQAFQKEKYHRINNKLPMGEYEKGFIDTGLWAYSRHPNFFAEQSIWVVFYLFSVYSSGELINWSISGAILLILLFHGSTDFTEEISMSKYPKFKEYIQKTPRLIPIKF